jgi:hypothetical protein
VVGEPDAPAGDVLEPGVDGRLVRTLGGEDDDAADGNAGFQPLLVTQPIGLP